jgi:hypothetical protein
MVEYILPNIDIVRENNRDSVFTHGGNVGIEINR